MYFIFKTKSFLKAFSKMKRSGTMNPRLVSDIEKTILVLASGEYIPPHYKDHALIGSMKDYRECHVRPDILIVYQKQDEKLILVLINIGSHSDLFG